MTTALTSSAKRLASEVFQSSTTTIQKRSMTRISQIYERSSFKSIGDFIDKRTLVLLDYDNTMGKPVSFNPLKRKNSHTLGSDQWFGHRITHHTSKGLAQQEAVDHALTDWFGVQCFTDAVPVELDTPDYIRQLQKEGHMVMGLTTRGAHLSLPTHRQLNSMNIDLTRTCPKKEELVFLNVHEVKYRYGMLFTSGTHKGDAFGKFLNLVEDVFPLDSFDTVLFINDKEKDLRQLQEKVDQLGKSFIGIRYSHMDEEVRNSDMAAADAQFDAMCAVLKNNDMPTRAEHEMRDEGKVGEASTDGDNANKQ